jgi:hypothetical protein
LRNTTSLLTLGLCVVASRLVGKVLGVTSGALLGRRLGFALLSRG